MSRELKAGILAIGTELLMGKTVNTNATFLSQKLNSIGIGVYYHLTVGDNPERIENMLKLLLAECDLIFTTGGLGPTLDDITKEIIAKALKLEMKLDQHSLDLIKERFKKFNRPMTDNNLRQAYFPEGAKILDNDMGTAPACIIDVPNTNKKIIVLPGPPRELNWIYDRYVENFLGALSSQKIESRYLSVYDMGESAIESELMDLISNQTDPTIATYAGDGRVLIRVTSYSKQKVDETVDKICDRIGGYIVSNEGKTLETVVSEMLIQKNLTISTVESCTGGKLISSIVKNEGVSSVVDRGIVTYSNKSKMEEVNVLEKTLLIHGAVSHETCSEMVKGLCKITGTDIGVSITGIAGPTGGNDEKPVGLVYIGIKVKDEVITYENQFIGDREMIQNRAVTKALKLIYNAIYKM